MFPALIWASHVVQLAKGIFPQEPGKIPKSTDHILNILDDKSMQTLLCPERQKN